MLIKYGDKICKLSALKKKCHSLLFCGFLTGSNTLHNEWLIGSAQ